MLLFLFAPTPLSAVDLTGVSQQQDLPGVAAILQLRAAPGWLCAVPAADQKLLLLRPEDELCNSSLSDLVQQAVTHQGREERQKNCVER